VLSNDFYAIYITILLTQDNIPSALTTLLPAVKAFFDEMAKRTGWAFSVLAGGPDPGLNGQIRTIALHLGEDRYNQMFSVANPNFHKDVLMPYRSFLYNVYGKHFI